jgi:hypothetical protein
MTLSSLNNYINKLILNVNKDNIPSRIDLILDGGAFNGAYQMGTLLYLKEMEATTPLKIKRISGTSIGSVLGALYLLDKLYFAPDMYSRLIADFRSRLRLDLFQELLTEIETKYLQEDDYKKLNNRLYITYYNNTTKRQIVCKTYKSNKDLIEKLKKTSHVPFLIDGNQTYNNYVDGVYPYIFKKNKRKILFINLNSVKHIKYIFTVKNEENLYGRLFEGIVDINTFFMTNRRTYLCSYVNNWTILDFGMIRMREMLWLFILFFIDIVFLIKNNLPECVIGSKYYIGCVDAMHNLYLDIVSHLMG